MSRVHHPLLCALMSGAFAVAAAGTADAALRPRPVPSPRPSSQTPTPAVHASVAAISVVAVPHRSHVVKAGRRHRHAHVTTGHTVAVTGTLQPVRHLHHRVVAVSSGPTGWRALDQAILRIPTYHAGNAIWLVSSKYGHWGTADWYHDTLYISPAVPPDMLYNVAVHEWSHELSVLDYNGNVDAAVAAMSGVFGGSGLDGAERAADCMARLQGATWTHYTSCDDDRWRQAAARLVAGQQL